MSQISTYLQCPRKYRFRYLDRRKPEHVGIDLLFGRAVHSALAWLVEEPACDTGPRGDELARVFRADFHAELSVGRIAWDGKAADGLLALGQALVGEAAPVLEGLAPTAAEVRVEAELVDPRTRRALGVPLVGYVDFVLDGGIGEVKTASRKTGPAQYLFQLAAYRYAWRQMHRTNPYLVLALLVKSARPAVLLLHPEVGDRDERWFLEVAAEVLDSLRREAFHPLPNYLCGRCEYHRACRMT